MTFSKEFSRPIFHASLCDYLIDASRWIWIFRHCPYSQKNGQTMLHNYCNRILTELFDKKSCSGLKMLFSCTKKRLIGITKSPLTWGWQKKNNFYPDITCKIITILPSNVSIDKFQVTEQNVNNKQQYHSFLFTKLILKTIQCNSYKNMKNEDFYSDFWINFNFVIKKVCPVFTFSV